MQPDAQRSRLGNQEGVKKPICVPHMKTKQSPWTSPIMHMCQTHSCQFRSSMAERAENVWFDEATKLNLPLKNMIYVSASLAKRSKRLDFGQTEPVS